MEKSKKLVCLLLVICALSALCAVGASAESLDSFSSSVSSDSKVATPSAKTSSRSSRSVSLNNISSSDQFSQFGWSVNPDFFFYNSSTVFGSLNGRTYTKTFDGPCFALLVYSPGSFAQYLSASPIVGEVTSNDANSYACYNQMNSETYTYDGITWRVCYGSGFSGNPSTSNNIPSLMVNSIVYQNWFSDLLDVIGFSVSEPEPEPEPDPDEYNPIPDVYDTVTPTLYFTNYKSTGDASFTYLNRSFSSFPSPDYAWTTQFPDVIVGAFYDNFSLVSQPLDSLCGQTSIVFTDPLGNFDTYDVTLNQRGTRAFTNVEIWLVSGSEPSISGFQYFTCPSDWVKTTLWRYPISPYSTEYVCNFQINFPEDYVQTVGFTPVNFFVRIYRSIADGQGVGRPYDVWYDVTNFVLGSYARPSSDPDDIPPTPYDPPFTDPSNPGQEVTNALDEEQSRIEDAYNPEEGQAAADSTFDLSALGSAFNRLVDGMGYTGTDFHFYMPSSGNVPFLNTTLWQQSEIPFKTWIDALPPAILTVIRFLAWLGLGFSFAAMIRKLISDINGGDKD